MVVRLQTREINQEHRSNANCTILRMCQSRIRGTFSGVRMEHLALELQRFNLFERLEGQMELAEVDLASLILEARLKTATLHWILQLTRRISEVASCDLTWDQPRGRSSRCGR